MELGSILLGLALFLAVAFWIALPLLERRAPDEGPAPAQDQLLAEHEAVLSALRDLDFDHATGKVAEEDYLPQRERWLAQGVEVLKELDRLGLAPDLDEAGAYGGPGVPADDAIEAAIASRRQAGVPAPDACSKCGAAARPGDLFCSRCGARLA